MEKRNDEDRLWSRAWDHHGGGIPGTVLRHLAFLTAIAAGYLIVRLALAPAWGGFWRDHAADVLAGLALPVIAALLSDPNTPAGRIVRLAWMRLAITAMAAIVWEVGAPLAISHSVGDPGDAVAYICGTLLYLVGSATYHTFVEKDGIRA